MIRATRRDGLPQNMADLRVGGIAAIAGGIGGLVGNVLHPQPPAETDALLRVVASMPHWTAIHLLIAVATVFSVGGLGLLMRTLAGDLARSVGRLAGYAAVVGGAALVAGIMIDGFGYPLLAREWLAAEGAEKTSVFWAAHAVHVVDVALFVVWATVLLGLSFVLAGTAVAVSTNYSRLLGLVAVVGGAMCLLFGVATALRISLPLPLWPLGPAVDSFWLVAAGVVMLRKEPR
jgi:hypothetical protein